MIRRKNALTNRTRIPRENSRKIKIEDRNTISFENIYTNRAIAPLIDEFFDESEKILKLKTNSGNKRSKIKIKARKIFENILHKSGNNSTSGWNF